MVERREHVKKLIENLEVKSDYLKKDIQRLKKTLEEDESND